MTQAVNLANFANSLDSSGGVSPTALNAQVPISKGGTNATTAAAARTNLGIDYATLINLMYPVGSIYTSTVSTNPATLFGTGTWVVYGAGRVLIGQDGSSYVAGVTGGSADATLVGHTHSFSGTSGVGGQHNHGFGYNSYNNSGWFGLGDWNGYGFPGANTINWNGSGGYVGTSGNQTSGNMMTTNAINSSSGDAHTHTVSGTTTSAGASATNANLQPYVVVYMWTRTA